MHEVHTYINSRLFPMGVGRNYGTPPTTILTYSEEYVRIVVGGVL